jgi:NIPSNAP
VITELRRYRIKPGRLESWLAFFTEAAAENERHGIRVEFAGVDRDTSTLVWLRTFDDEADRVAKKDAFYGSDWWLEREDWAMDHILEYSVEFLDTALVRGEGRLESLAMDGAAERAGSRGDTPPTGWAASEGRRFTRL